MTTVQSMINKGQFFRDRNSIREKKSNFEKFLVNVYRRHLKKMKNTFQSKEKCSAKLCCNL